MIFNKYFIATMIAASAAFSPLASATVIDTEVANPDKLINPTTSFSYTHNLADKGFLAGITEYLSGTLVIRLTDTTAGEDGRINYGSQFINTGNIMNNTQDDPSPAGTLFTIVLNATALADLNTDGVLAMTIQSTRNTFYFADSTLTLEERPQAAVPEPLSMSLLAVGAIGLCASRRRMRKS